MIHFVLLAKLLLLLCIAHGLPLIAKRICGTRFSQPIDGGLRFFDGYPLFGTSKTIRGLLVSIAATTAAAPVLGLEFTIGAVVAGSAMVGDLFSSFLKRRLVFRQAAGQRVLTRSRSRCFRCLPACACCR